MKIVVDENISYGEEAFSSIGEVMLSHGREIDNPMLKDADALVVRSITNVDETLLNGTNVKFVGTATIGTDHVDKVYLKEKGITFASAAGCNSHAVKEYVFTAITHLAEKHNISLVEKSIGIIGVGNIGSKNVRVAEKMGLTVLKNDPPLQRQLRSNEFCSLDEALQCDIVTFHVPLNRGGTDNTFHLLNEYNLPLVKPGAILINSSRGPVVDNNSLKDRLKRNNDLHVVLDVWEKEPHFDTELLSLIELGTAHIAGYSLEGKVNGTTMIYDALCNHLEINPKWKPDMPKVENNKIIIDPDYSLNEQLFSIFNQVYPIGDDDKLMRKTLTGETENVGAYFDSLRKNYRLRRELNNFTVENEIEQNSVVELLKELRIEGI